MISQCWHVRAIICLRQLRTHEEDVMASQKYYEIAPFVELYAFGVVGGMAREMRRPLSKMPIKILSAYLGHYFIHVVKSYFFLF